MYVVLLVLLLLLLLGAVPPVAWHPHTLGVSGPIGFFLIVLLIVLIIRG